MNIETKSIKSLTIGDVFTMAGNGPYVVTGIVRGTAHTTVEYRTFDTLPRGQRFEFFRPSLTVVTVIDHFYSAELYTANKD